MSNPIQLGDTLLVALVADMSSVRYQHLLVWQHTETLSSDQYYILQNGSGQFINPNTFEINVKGTAILMLRTTQSMDDFNKWWDSYAARFNGHIDEQLIPMPTPEQHISGYMMPHDITMAPVMTQTRPENYMDEWAWVCGHCTGKVHWTFTHWIFETQSDAVLFKLTFK